MKRTFILASTLGFLFAGTGVPVATASTGPAFVNAGTTYLASGATAGSNKDKKELRKAKKATQRTERLNRENLSRGSSSSRESSRGSSRSRSNDRSGDRADRDRGRSGRDRDRGHSSRNDRHHSDRDHDRHRGHSYSNSRRHRDRHDHGVHVSIGTSGVYYGSRSNSYRGHRSYSRHRSYGHSSHYRHSRPYRYYQPRSYYRPYYRYTTPVIEREIVVVERPTVVRETVVVERPSVSSVAGLRGWDYLVHGESARAQTYFSDVCQSYYGEGLPKLGFGFSALARGDLRNGAHGIRRAFEFDAGRVSDGPAVDGFGQLVAELRAGVTHRIETDAHVTKDHWFLSAAMAFYDRDYHNAKYAIDAAKNLGDVSRGCVALAQMIDGKIAYEASMR